MEKYKAHTIQEECSDIDELPWYEKDLCDFELDAEVYCDTETDSDADEVLDDKVDKTDHHSQHVKKSSSRLKKKSCRKSCETMQEISGKTYPLDVWFLIARFIQPEDVNRFSCICTSAHYVIHASIFWMHLYKKYKYYKSSLPLPVELTPDNLERTHGLKERVVRFLFHTYPTFVKRIKSAIPFEHLSYHLEGFQCVLMWHERPANQQYWNFFFKFRRALKPAGCNLLKKSQRKLDLINGMNDIDFNPEDGCCVLHIKCGSYVSMAAMMGLVLSKIMLSVGQNLRYNKLKLTFQSKQLHSHNSHCTADAVTAVFDPVINAQVLYWWDPRYPRPQFSLISE